MGKWSEWISENETGGRGIAVLHIHEASSIELFESGFTWV